MKTFKHYTRYRPSLQKRTRKPVSKAQGQLFSHTAKKTKPSWIKKTLYFILFLSIIVGLGYLFFLSGIFKIQKILIETKDLLLEKTSIEETTNTLKGKNLLLFDAINLNQNIREQHPELEFITIKKIFPDTLKLELISYPIVANLINRFDIYEKKFELNQNGLIVLENTENPELPYIIIKSETPFEIKTEVIKKEKLTFALEAMEKFQNIFKMPILDATYKRIEREIHLRTEKNFYVWIDTEKDLDSQLNKLKRAIPRLDIYNIPLEYIDLRIIGTNNEKVIYKK